MTMSEIYLCVSPNKPNGPGLSDDSTLITGDNNNFLLPWPITASSINLATLIVFFRTDSLKTPVESSGGRREREKRLNSKMQKGFLAESIFWPLLPSLLMAILREGGLPGLGSAKVLKPLKNSPWKQCASLVSWDGIKSVLTKSSSIISNLWYR